MQSEARTRWQGRLRAIARDVFGPRPSEKVAVGRALEELEIPSAAERRAATLRQGSDAPRSVPVNGTGEQLGAVKFTGPIGHGDVRDLVGSAVGQVVTVSTSPKGGAEVGNFPTSPAPTLPAR